MSSINRVRYVQSGTDLSDSWKVDTVAVALDVPYVQVLGHLHLLWWFTANATHDSQEFGDLSRFTASILERRMRWSGTAGALVDALVASGWLDDVDGALFVHDWGDHSGAGVVRMNRNAARMRSSRAGNDVTNARADTVQARADTVQARADTVRVQTSDAESTEAVRVLREVLNIGKLDASVRRAIVAALPDPTTDELDRLRRAAEAWKLRGYSPRNIAGILEWYVGGIPDGRRPGAAGATRDTASSNMRAMGAALSGDVNDANQTGTRRRSRFTSLLAGSVPATNGTTGGSSVVIAGVLGGGSATSLADR
jgi:hypothetical protein